MNLFLTKMTTALLGMSGMADISLPAEWKWVENIVNAVNTLLYPLLIVVGAAGMIYAVVIGVNMARADSTEKREEAKKKLINVIVGIAIIIALILFFKLFIEVILPNFITSDGVQDIPGVTTDPNA